MEKKEIKLNHFNIYAVIKEDTNRDKQLDSKDKIALYVSNYDGKNLKEISSSVYYLDCIDKNTFLFAEYEDGKVTFYEYDGNFLINFLSNRIRSFKCFKFRK